MRGAPDTGVLRTEPGGAVRITVTRPPGTEDLTPDLWLRRDGAARGTKAPLGARSELVLFEDQPHGFFNQGRGDNSNYLQTVEAMDRFLASLDYLTGEPTIRSQP